MDQDRNTIGLTSEAQKQLEAIQLKGWFEDAQDAARFACALAIREGLQPAETKGSDTRWAIGGFDKSGEFRAMMAALHPETATPVKALEYLTNEGLRLLHERLVSRGQTPAALFG
ncbi:MAG: hypothetical protein V4499_02985 [Pseudomonadota bacterium]